MPNFLGLYWTLPVPWAGFTSLPKDPDAAAQASRTISYQRERVRRWVKEEGGTLVHEEVFLELAPDRGTEHILPVVDRLLKRCEAEKAKLVLVEFWTAYGWRRHGLLAERLGANEELCILLDPVPLTSAAGQFDPVEHFRTWRGVEEWHASSKPDRQAELAQAVAELQGMHTRLQDLATAMNEAGYRTATGRKWTGDNLRKFLRSL